MKFSQYALERRAIQVLACAQSSRILGAQNQKKKSPPRMVSDQIAYKLKCVIELFSPPNFSLI